MLKKLKGTGYALALAGLALALPRAAGAEEFVCHVLLDNAMQDLVFVEADDRVQASRMADAATVPALDRKRIGVKVVKECIVRFKEEFADPDAAALLARKLL